ncbi:MAG: ATP-dependent zinc metalloprotease FtsH [Spirochaetales bacterium]|jgi:cell division protease FtsH|nr:ATP-dependent zinc metalloprotease FtsH [Spirochaetales bacterium]
MSKIPQPGSEKPDPNQSGSRMTIFHLLIVGFIFTFILNSLAGVLFPARNRQISYDQFLSLTEKGLVRVVRVNDDRLELTLREDAAPAEVEGILSPQGLRSTGEPEQPQSGNTGNTVLYTGRLEDPGLPERLKEQGITFYRPLTRSSPLMGFFSSWILPIVIMYVLFLLFRNIGKRAGGALGGMMNVGKSRAKVYDMEKNTGITFADVAGQDEAKETLQEMADFLHNPERYLSIGAKQPKGALLVGPPGTGKTLLAKAVAGEAKVPFFSLSGSEFVEMFVGVGASRVRDLFEQAAKNAPCIVFIDEIDAIGKSRDNQMGSNDEREQTLNQLLSEMDGFDSSKGIVILAATNRPEILDKALLRPGRFDRRVIVERPDLPGRLAILQVHLVKVKAQADINLKEIALATSGATGADLANMVNEAALRAVRMNRSLVSQEDLMEAVELVIAGKEKKDRILSPKEKQMVAFHEVGHALAAALQKDAQPIQKITIVPRTMGSLGYTMNMPEEERYLMTRSEMLSQITTLLAGMAAEETEFGEISTGASNDIERATKLARSMVTQYGMSEAIGPVGLESLQNQYLDGRFVFKGSDHSASLADQEVREIIGSCHTHALNLLKNNKPKLKEIAGFLIDKETINGVQFMTLLKGAPA